MTSSSNAEAADDSAEGALRLATWLLAGVAVLLAIPTPAWESTQVIGQSFPVVDASWELDMVARLGHGELAGRDFVFTHGPLYQLVHGLGLLVQPGDLATILRFHHAGEALAALALVAIVLRGAGTSALWCAAALVGFAAVALSTETMADGALKPLVGLAACVLAGRWVALPGAPGTGRALSWGAGVLLAAAVPLAVLYSFDVGVMTLVALLGSFVLVGLAARRAGVVAGLRRAILGSGVVVAGAGLFVAATLAAPAWRHYLLDSWRGAASYAQVMAAAAEPGVWAVLLVTLAAGLLLLIGAGWALVGRWRRGDAMTAQAGAVLAGGVFSLLWLRYALTRSDWSHAYFALLPTWILVALVLPGLAVRGGRIAAPLVAAIVLLVGLVLLDRSFNPQRVATLRIPRGLGFRTELVVRQAEVARAAETLSRIDQREVFVYPQESLLALVAGKRNPLYTMQCYAAGCRELEDRCVERLDPLDELCVYVPRDVHHHDDVQNEARSGRIFRWMLENCELARPPSDSAALLQPAAPETRRWMATRLPIEPGAGRFVPRGDGMQWPIDVSALDARASDYVVAEIRVADTRLWGLGKPGRLRVRMMTPEGRRCEYLIVVPHDGRVHEVLLPTMDSRGDPLFFAVFAPRRWWRAAERLSAIELAWEPIDSLSIAPEFCEVLAVRGLARADCEVLETSLRTQNLLDVQAWCYRDGDRPE